MANIIAELKTEFRILAVDYNGQYAGCEKPFSSRRGEAEDSISQADWILVLDRGRIAEEGTYGELTARNGLFSRMIETQERMSGGWNPEKEAER
ncbi:MAG: hypothetical protein E7576_03525 [Ruminococcaceae bacterium]|nr:hypothetical protein [Oscillospiraceae bacterium]